jgi:hypothetical protein
LSSINFIERPQLRILSDYDSSISLMVEKLNTLQGVHAVYQIGSVSAPGLSDIDMLVVFEDNVQVDVNPVHDFGFDNYLFTHSLYGISKSKWNELHTLTFFNNYKHLSGELMHQPTNTLSDEEISHLKRQIAMEFLIKMYIVMTVQLQYKIIKLRSFLLEGKALIYDLEFLNIKKGKLHDLVSEIIHLRNTWFEKQVSDESMTKLVTEVYNHLKILLDEQFNIKPIYLPNKTSHRISRNIQLNNGDILSVNHHGIRLPGFGILSGKKHFNFLHRINNFEFSFPYIVPEINSAEYKLFNFLSELRKYNSCYIPAFMIPASSLKII